MSMSTEVIAAIVAGGIAAYGALAGVAWQLAGANWTNDGPMFAAIFWPLALPAMLGARLVRRLATRGVRLPRAQVRP
jgi:hypothetical protein